MNSSDTNALAQQYAALTTGAGIAPLARTRIELTGRDRAKFLHNFCTNDINRLTPATGCEIFITSVQGKVLGHGHVLCEEDRLLFDGVSGQAEALLPHLDKYLITEDVTLADHSAQTATFLLAGEAAADKLADASGIEVSPESSSHANGEIAGMAVTAARIPLAGPTSLLVSCPAEQAAAVHATLVAAGCLPCEAEAEAVESLRIETGYPLYGRDITEANLPQEVDRDAQAISFTKGCYLGQETVARIDALGHVNKKLVALKLDGEAIPTADTAIFPTADQEKPVGHITSAAYSPRHEAPLALAYLRTQHTPPGTKLHCAGAAASVLEFKL